MKFDFADFIIVVITLLGVALMVTGVVHILVALP